METIELLAGARKIGESNKALQACNDWLRMGPGRSLAELQRRYSRTQQNSAPTTYLNTLQRWSADYAWQDRAEAYDTGIEAQKTAYAESIMRSGLALAHERVFFLKELVHSLAEQIWDEDGGMVEGKVWLRDIKIIGSGKDARELTVKRFNHHLIEQFRGALDDIAKETGGRKAILEHSGPGGKPIQTEDVTMDDKKRARKIAQLLNKVRDRADRDEGK